MSFSLIPPGWVGAILSSSLNPEHPKCRNRIDVMRKCMREKMNIRFIIFSGFKKSENGKTLSIGIDVNQKWFSFTIDGV